MTTTIHPVPTPDPDHAADKFATSPRGQQLLGLLRDGVAIPRIIAIGRYRNSWTAPEVLWAKRYYVDAVIDDDQWIPAGYDPQPRTVAADEVHITPRIAEALDGLCRGLSVAEIAAEIGVAHNTAEQYVRSAVRGLGATSRLNAIQRAQSGQVRLFLLERGRGSVPATAIRVAS